MKTFLGFLAGILGFILIGIVVGGLIYASVILGWLLVIGGIAWFIGMAVWDWMTTDDKEPP